MYDFEYLDHTITILLLGFVCWSCLIGSYSKLYEGTILQRIGLFLVALWALWESYNIINLRYVPPEVFIASIGLSTFSLGTIVKTYFWNKKKC